MINSKLFFKNLIHKSSNNLIKKYLIKKKTVKTFARYNIDKKALEYTKKVVGWVPYVKNQTDIKIFNFFSINYNIRKPISGKIFLVEKNEIIKQHDFILFQEELKEIKCENIFDKLNGSSIIVQLESNQIKSSHGSHDGHLRFWGCYKNQNGNYCSVTHSMPISFNDLFLTKQTNSRDYNINNNELKKINFYPGGRNDYNTDQFSYYGFNIILNKYNDPLSAWHLSPKNTSSESDKNYLQGFYCPDIRNIDPYVILDNIETGLNNNKIQCYIYKNDKIDKISVLETNNKFTKRVSEIFSENIKAPYFFFISYSSKPIGHSHVHYAFDDRVADQVHMHECNWEIKDKKFFPIEIISKKNCRKFFIVNNEQNYDNLIMLHVDKVFNKKFCNLKIRLLNKEKEMIKNLQISSDQPIKIIDLNKINNDEINSSYVVQIESYDYNFSASLISFCESEKILATDHFTGG
jgi:hypothetical protein